MGDAVASSSSPVTPTSILICREDGNDIFPDADDGADFSVAGEDRLLAVDQDDEYFAVLLSKERASADAGAPTEELEEWMMAMCSGRVRWVIKVIPALFPFFLSRSHSSCGKNSIFPVDPRSSLCGALQTTAMFRFGGKTAYVAVTYLDRFLAQRKVDVT
jgi:cyclin D5, plant